MTELEKITKQINKYNTKLKELIQLRQKICPHDNIDETSYCNDEFTYFLNRIYTTSYLCKDCGLHASSDVYECSPYEVSEVYKLLKEKYRQIHHK